MRLTSPLVLTAILVTSVLVAAGAVSPVSPQARADTVTAVESIQRAIPVAAVQSAVPLGATGGMRLLSELTTSSVSSVTNYLRQNPAEISAVLASPPKASEVVSWWGELPASARTSVSRSAPQLVGNLDGVPFAVRDVANRLNLTRSIEAAEDDANVAAVGSGGGRAQGVYTRHHADVLQQVARTLVTAAGQPRRQLLTFDPTGQVRAAVVVGDLATADYVSYLVPGMFFTVWGQMYDWTVIAADLQREQSQWLGTLGATDASLHAKTSATVSWIGYKTPGALDIVSLASADAGAKYLRSAVTGLQASRTGHEPFITLVTHSYGSTAAMIDLDGGGLTVDALAIIGSPGGVARSASALAVAGGNVFVGEAAWDPVAHSGFYGEDPGSPSFGAHRMDVAASTDAVTGRPLAAAIGHLGYFDSGTTAMRNIALIALDRSALVSRG